MPRIGKIFIDGEERGPAAPEQEEVGAARAAGIDWPRLRELVRGSRKALAAMLAASAFASAAGVVPALMLSPIVDDLTGERKAPLGLVAETIFERLPEFQSGDVEGFCARWS